MKLKNCSATLRSVAVSILFGALNALNCWLFIVPNNFASAGVEGIAIMIQKLTPINLAYIQLAINIPLCVFSFFCIDKKFAAFTSLYTVSYSLFYLLFQTLKLQTFRYAAEFDTIYPVVIAGVISGFAYGILFRENSSSGGIDIISKFINKRHPKFNFFYITFSINAIIAIASYFVFAKQPDGSFIYSWRPVCMCVLCEFIGNTIGDKIIKGGESAYKFFVIADDVSGIEKEISQTLVHTSTRFGCYGSYTNKEKQSLMCLVTKNEIVEFEKILKKHPDCFAYIETINKVIGYFDK